MVGGAQVSMLPSIAQAVGHKKQQMTVESPGQKVINMTKYKKEQEENGGLRIISFMELGEDDE